MIMETRNRLHRLVLATLVAVSTALPVLASGPDPYSGPRPRLDLPTSFGVGPVLDLAFGSSSSGCAECEGGVVELTVRYNGETAASIVVKDDVKTYFSGTVQPFETITVKGTRSDGKFEKNDLQFLVGGTLNTKIHVSCSQPINPGLVFGAFTVVDAISRTGGRVCPTTNSGCAECEGGVTELTLRYDGTTAATIVVRDDRKTYFSGVVQPGADFTFSGTRSDGKFEKNDLDVLVNGRQNTRIHVSCSQPINPGLTFGAFTVVDAISRTGGRVCPVTTSNCAQCKGGVTSLTLRYDGSLPALVVVKDSNKTYYSGSVQPGAEFTFTGTRSDGKFEKNDLDVLVNGVQNTEIHVSCSQPINPGLSFGSFTVTAAVSKDGGNVCPLETNGCFECKDGIRSMTFRYEGTTATRITFSVGTTKYFDRTVQPGETFTVDNGGAKFAKNDVTVKIGSATHTVHVSCSDPDVKPGYVVGGVLVMTAGTSGDGPMCGAPTCDIDLELQKEFVPEESNLGQGLVMYRLTLTNTAEAKTLATLITVKDLVPGGGTVESAVAAWGTTFNKATATWNVPILGVGETVSVLIGVRYAGTLPAQPNCAEVRTAVGDDVDSTPGNWAGSPIEDDEACAPVAEPPKIDVSLRKSVSNPYPARNDVVTFTLVVRNEGPADATNVRVKDYMPDGVLYVDGSASTEPGITFDKTTMTWLIAKLEPGDMPALTFQAKVTVIGERINCAEVRTHDQEDIDSVPGVVSGTTLNCATAPSEDLEDDETFVKIWISEDPQVNDAICYVVADNDSSGGETEDFLSKLTPDGQVEMPIGKTGTVAVEGIAFNPWNGVLFAANGPCLGTLDLNTAQYTQIGCAGSGMGYDQYGNYTEQAFDDMDGLTFDPHTGELYANLRKTEFGIDDIIIKLNPLTGKAVKNAFGPGIDYISIKGVGDLTDLDDIAIDPVDGTMYGINNDESENARLVKIDKMTGQMSDVKKLPVDNVEGLGFFGDGTLYGTGAEGFENILIINKQTLAITIVSSLGARGNFDYESIDCLVTNPSNTRVTLFDDADGNGVLGGSEVVLQGVDVEVYRDSDGDGMVSDDDRLLTTTTSGPGGLVDFSTPANGAFVFKVSGSLLGESELGVNFEGFGERFQGTLAVSAAASTSNQGAETVPTSYRLVGNYPNPFNPVTSITFEAPATGRVRLSVFDLLGREVSLLVDGEVHAGRHTVTFDASSLPSGTYLYRLQTQAGAWTRSLTLLK